MNETARGGHGPRCVALVGPYATGKTTLLEALLYTSGAIDRQGTVDDATSVGDTAPEARHRGMSVEVDVTATSYLEDPWHILDCPGSVEFIQDAYNSLMVADAAVVVCDPDPERAATVGPLLKFLDDHAIPHVLFLNKMDSGGTSLKEMLAAYQNVSDRPLVLREVPYGDGEKVTGFIDLVSERAYDLNETTRDDLVRIPDEVRQRESEARQELLEHLADHDDHLLEELLEDINPPTGEIYDNLSRDFHEDLIVPVFFGSARHTQGIQRLWKALRHEAPEARETAERQGMDPDGEGFLGRVFKTRYASHAGKQSLLRVWRGTLEDTTTVDGGRVGGLFDIQGDRTRKRNKAAAGEVVAVSRLDEVPTGALISEGRSPTEWENDVWPAPLPAVYALAVAPVEAGDDVKLTEALHKLCEEDPSLSTEQREEPHELVLWGQGDIHLQTVVQRLHDRFGLEVTTDRPHTPYRETVRQGTSQHARHKKQHGGHGEFGDVHVDIRPLERGEGFRFEDTIVAGVIPKQFIPAVEEGVRDALQAGPLGGFPVTDVVVTLTDGQSHSVDSSEVAFRKAGHMAMRDGLAKCDPVLLEPVAHVQVMVPNDYTSKVQRVLAQRRAQILGFAPRPGWETWDLATAYMPQAEMQDLIIELRSLSMGVGYYTWRFDHMQEVSGKEAERVISARAARNNGNNHGG